MLSSLIAFIIQMYIFLIIIDAVLSFFPQFREEDWYLKLRQTAEFTEAPIRKYLPRDLPIDLSPVIVIILLNIFLMIW